jgi:MscS family membrane protein
VFDDFITQLSGFNLPDPLLRLLLILAVLILTWLLQRLARWLILRLVELLLKAVTRISSMDLQLEASLSQALVRPVQILIVALGLRLALALLNMADFMVVLIDRTIGTLVVIALFWLLHRIVDVVAQFYVSRAARETSSLDETIVRFVRQTITLLIVVFALTLILQQWGLDVGALVAGLGVASLAVALAAQDALSNVVAYFAILADAPFKVGDFIVIDDLVKGRVQEISFRSTRIRTLDNSILVIPNHTIANANVINWARTRKRRLDITLGVTYSSTAGQIEAVLADLKDLLENHPQVTNDRHVVDFVNFNNSSLDLRVSFMVRGNSWEDLEDAKTVFNLEFMRILKKHGLSIAFPTRTVHLAQATLPEQLPGDAPEA